MKLKKAKRVQREIKEETLQTVALKHHEFENMPQIEEPEHTSKVAMSKEVGDGKLEKRKKSTKVKGKKLSTDTDRSEDVDETDEVTEATEVTTDTPTQQTKEPESIAKIQVTTKW